MSGGKETSSMGASQISSEAFAKALAESIEKSGLFAKVSTAGARYRLTAFIGKVDQPMFGFSMTVKWKSAIRSPTRSQVRRSGRKTSLASTPRDG